MRKHNTKFAQRARRIGDTEAERRRDNPQHRAHQFTKDKLLHLFGNTVLLSMLNRFFVLNPTLNTNQPKESAA